MNLLTRRRSETSHDAVQPPEATEETTIRTLEWTGPAAWISKAMTGFLVSCLIAGPIGLILAGWMVLTSAGTPPPTPNLTSDTGLVDERAAVSSFASDFVVAWLTTARGDEKRLAPFLPDTTALNLPAQSWIVSNPSVAGIEFNRLTWSVTVAATVAQSSTTPGDRRYYRVAVSYTEGSLAAQLLPAPVAAPNLGPVPRLGYSNRASLNDPPAVAAGEFLNALLISGADVTRFISPGARIQAITPAPYLAVHLEDVQLDRALDPESEAPKNGDRLRLLVTAAASTDSAHEISVQYALTMTARAGRWEVTSIDATPASLKPAAQSSSTGTTQTPAPTTSPEPN